MGRPHPDQELAVGRIGLAMEMSQIGAEPTSACGWRTAKKTSSTMVAIWMRPPTSSGRG